MFNQGHMGRSTRWREQYHAHLQNQRGGAAPGDMDASSTTLATHPSVWGIDDNSDGDAEDEAEVEANARYDTEEDGVVGAPTTSADIVISTSTRSQSGTMSTLTLASSHPRSRQKFVGPVPRRRRYRSRNCRNFRRYGTFFQFLDPIQGSRSVDAAQRLHHPHHRMQDGRTAEMQQDALHAQLMAMEAHVQVLQRQRDLIQSIMVNTRENAATFASQITNQFYTYFHHGYDPARHAERCQEAAQFLHGVMTHDVLCTEFRGVEPFLRQYEMASQNHISMAVELRGVSVFEQSADVVQIKAEAVAKFRISRDTLIKFFPMIIQDEELTQRLIGQEYEMQYDKVFHFREGRIFQHESRIDFCSGMLRMVGDPFLAMKLLQASLLTKHGHWKLDKAIREDQYEIENSAL